MINAIISRSKHLEDEMELDENELITEAMTWVKKDDPDILESFQHIQIKEIWVDLDDVLHYRFSVPNKETYVVGFPHHMEVWDEDEKNLIPLETEIGANFTTEEIAGKPITLGFLEFAFGLLNDAVDWRICRE